MLGDNDFVEGVLSVAMEQLDRKYALAARGIGYEHLIQMISKLTAVPVEAIAGTGKQRQNVRARSLLCYWAAKELGMSLMLLSHKLEISVPTVSVAVQRGMKIAENAKLDFRALLNVET